MASEHVGPQEQKYSVLNSSFPVLLPRHHALFMSEADFQAFVKKSLGHEGPLEEQNGKTGSSADPTKTSKSVSRDGRKRKASSEASNLRLEKGLFVQGTEEEHETHFRNSEDSDAENLDEDATGPSSECEVIDLFYNFTSTSDPSNIRASLHAAWKEGPLLTLKVIFNARSIHLGKSSRGLAYLAFGWLADYHPLTLLANLKWLIRPIIPKVDPDPEQEVKAKVKADEDEDTNMVDAQDTDAIKVYDVENGVSHGYWKDLLNLLVFSADDQLKWDGEPQKLLRIYTGGGKKKRHPKLRNWDQDEARKERRQKNNEQNERVQNKMNTNPFYLALHLSVARLFAEQLKADKALLDSGKPDDFKKISLAAKWAPTFGEFHDKHTFVLSTIAEYLYPSPEEYCPDPSNRELYLRHVRELYRKQYASPLRKALQIVEHDIVAETFENILYEKVPSLAMDRYTDIFIKKDWARFKSYMQGVARKGQQQKNISDAITTLRPSTLIAKARTLVERPKVDSSIPRDYREMKSAAENQVQRDIVDAQWNTLVAQVCEAGKLSSAIAVYDHSGRTTTRFKDGSSPIDLGLGLSLLIAEANAPPFGGGYIHFDSSSLDYLNVGGDHDTRGLVEKMRSITSLGYGWGSSTSFVAVYEEIILPMAIANKLPSEDMVKHVFVFSDVEFETEQVVSQRWSEAYERIKAKFTANGYDIPRLVCWNLAASTISVPRWMEATDAMLISGYSESMVKRFLETGGFDKEDEIGAEDVGMQRVEQVQAERAVERRGPRQSESEVVPDVYHSRRQKISPLSVVIKAVSHPAFDVLEVVD